MIENAYAPYPESIKGLFAVLASRQPVRGLAEHHFSSLASPSLASVLVAYGYDTALFHSGRFMYLGMDTLVANSGFQRAEDAGDIGGERQSSFGVDDRRTVQRMFQWIDSRESRKRFFIHYLPIGGHHPYDAPAGPWPSDNDRGRYLNALHESDAVLGELLAGLDARDLSSRTLLVIHGDHGEAFGEHPGNYGHTLFLYEENVRVPLIFSAPGALPPGTVSRVTSLVDLAPTICELLGARVPDEFEGLSLLGGRSQPALLLTEYSLRLLGLREGQWKFIFDTDSGHARLFNLSMDPNERTNVSDLNPELVRSFTEQLFPWKARAEKTTLRTNL